jgi:hypothetical protein
VLFDADEPADIGYFDADDEWGKMVLRQAQRHDYHVYRVLSARVMSDLTQVRTFARQDDRLSGNQRDHFDNRWNRATDNSMELFHLLDEAVVRVQDVQETVPPLIAEEKQA